MYREGRGVPQDYIQAHMWYTVARKQANRFNEISISDALYLVERVMTLEQIEEAQRLADEWKPKRKSPED